MADRVWNSILVPSAEQWGLRNTARSGGQSFAGNEQVVESPAARVAASLTIPCNTPAKVLAMRAALALGRAQVWIVGPVEVSRAPWGIDPLVGGAITYAQQDASAAPPYDRAIDVVLRDAAPLNATTLVITRRAGGFLLPGQYLSIGNRLHTIVDLASPNPINPLTEMPVPGDLAVVVRPWTRAAYGAGAPIELGRPVCRMRLASDDTGALQLQLSRLGTVTLDLVEAF